MWSRGNPAVLLFGAIVLAWLSAISWAQSPAPLSEAQRAAALEAVQRSLESGARTVGQVLTDPSMESIREDARFRNLVRRHTRTSSAVLAPTNEPGTPLVVRGRVRDVQGQPVADARIYVFHTNSQGSYSSSGGNATMGDALNPRLFGYLVTGADGTYEYRTVRPGPYPGDGPPAHVHYEVVAAGYEKLVTELIFRGDARLTPQAMEEFTRAGFVIAEVKDDAGVQRCVCDLVLRKR